MRIHQHLSRSIRINQIENPKGRRPKAATPLGGRPEAAPQLVASRWEPPDLEPMDLGVMIPIWSKDDAQLLMRLRCSLHVAEQRITRHSRTG